VKETEKTMATLGLFENLLEDPMIVECDMKSEKIDLLSTSMQESGLFGEHTEDWRSIAALETDDFLDSILTGSGNKDVQNALDRPLSDTSSDSGCNLEQQILSPDLVEYLPGQSDDDDETPNQAMVNPRTNSPESEIITMPNSFETGATTIILPVITPKSVKVVKSSATKRRRVSASSNDSGVDDIPKFTVTSKRGKYPALELSEEEKRICEREGIKLPTHYPLSREEERNLKRIRRKIRNKVSAQDSRRRKKEYIDNMEDRVRACTEENNQLHKRIEQLETQNKTLASQMKRLHQIIINGGFTTRQNQTSTAMMVLLLSTALFLFPGFKDHQESTKQAADVDITRAIKVPPLPGQSRSLLQFAPTIKDEFNVASENAATPVVVDNKNVINKIKEEVDSSSPFHDHDYFVVKSAEPPLRKKQKISYIEADVPPQGYGFVDAGDKAGGNLKFENDVYVVVEDDSESQINVNVTGGSENGMRTVVLHVPKDLK